MNQIIKFTVFTAVYNAEKFFQRVYESVVGQTYLNFEWIIINDGSIDKTDEIIQESIKGCNLDIKYINNKRNKGKTAIWNQAVDIATGELFLPADADDTFLNNTLEFFAEKWQALSSQEKEKLSGINVLCYNPANSEICGSPYESEGMLSDALHDTFINPPKIRNERWGCVRVDLLKQHKFPVLEKYSYYPIGYVWHAIALDGYQYICYNKPLRAYFYEPNSIVNSPQRYVLKRIVPVINNQKWRIKYLVPYFMEHGRKNLVCGEYIRLVKLYIRLFVTKYILLRK